MKEYELSPEKSTKATEPDTSGSYTVKDYLSWTFEDFFEIIRGRVWRMSPAPTSSHQRISFKLSFELGKVFNGNKCEIFNAPFDVYLVKEGEPLEKGKTVVQPDICVVCDLEKIHENGCVGAPDLVVEILSPSTAKKDLNDKFNTYQEFGIKEYWIVFPGEKAINIYTLVNGSYELHKTYKHDELLQSPLFEKLQFRVNEIF